MHTRKTLIEAFSKAGLSRDDVVLVHSSLRKLGPVEGGADTVLDALLEVLGEGGTLALPTHTFRLLSEQQPVFHQTLTPTNVGVLTNVFRQRPGVIRGLHPTHSVAAVGPRAAELVEGQERNTTPCPEDSPYGRLRDWGGKILIIGEGLNCCTFFHGCEQWAGMPWAVRKDPIQLYCVRADGKIFPFQMHLHRVNTWDQYPRLDGPLQKIGAMKRTHIGTCELRFLDARKTADWLVPQLQQDASIILPDDFKGE